jgi:bla regulator protein BlaR1
LDGSGFLPSMRKMFSKSAYKKYQLMTKEDLKTLNTQAESYAKVYLKQIGRNAEVQIQLDHKYLPEIDDGVSNYLLRAYGDYPYWIGTSEKVKNNIRYVYERAWEDKGNGNGILTLTKRIYQGDIIEKTVIEIIGDKIKCLEGNLKLKEEKYIK